MSELKVNAISNAAGTGSITIGSDGSISYPNFGRRNLIINGAMQVAQRGTSFTSPSSGSYTLDRWRLGHSGQEVALDISQASDAPAGLASSYKITLTTPESSLTTSNQINVSHRFEGQNLQSLKKGTSSAESFTLSFWVKSAVTGIYSIDLYDGDNTRQYVTTYSVSSTDTWEHKIITIPGDTIGAFDNDANASLYISWWVDAGPYYTTAPTTNAWQTYDENGRAVATGKAAFMTTTGATWQITGVQLEVGSVATPFEHRSYGEELALCQRYYVLYKNEVSGNDTALINGTYYNSTQFYGVIHLPVPMRTNPTFSYSNGTNHFRIYSNSNSGDYFNTWAGLQQRSTKSPCIYVNSGVSGTQGTAGWVELDSDDAYVAFDAEL